MSKNLLNKYVWLVETIYNAKFISFEEINRRWLDNDISEGLEIPKRTFHTWINEAEELFGISILCEHWGDFRYYIENPEEIKKGGLRNWLLNTISTSNLLMENKSLNERILLEVIPSGQDFLAVVLGAMKKSKVLEVTYKGYWSEHEHTFPVAPYCVKLFRQRWYMVANSVNEDTIRIYSLDRVLDLQLTDESFQYPKKFSPENYFKDCFGIIHDDDIEVETVKLKVNADQSNYLRSLPLHHSQEEIETKDEYSIFTLRVCPTFDFQQELLWNGDALEVLEPTWLRKDMAATIKRMSNNYKK